MMYILSFVWHELKNFSLKLEHSKNHMMGIITDNELIDKGKMSTVKNVIKLPPIFATIRSKSLKIFEYIKVHFQGLLNRVLRVWCLEKEAEDNQNRDEGTT